MSTAQPKSILKITERVNESGPASDRQGRRIVQRGARSRSRSRSRGRERNQRRSRSSSRERYLPRRSRGGRSGRGQRDSTRVSTARLNSGGINSGPTLSGPSQGGSPFTAASDLVRCIMLPGRAPPFRLNIGWTQFPTTTLRFKDVLQPPTIGTVVTNQLIPANETLMFLFGDPNMSYGFVDNVTTVSGGAWGYDMYFTVPNSSGQLTATGLFELTANAAGGASGAITKELAVELPIAYGLPASSYAPFGPLHAVGTTSGSEGTFMLLQAGTVVTFATTFAASGGNYAVGNLGVFKYWAKQHAQGSGPWSLVLTNGGATTAVSSITYNGTYTIPTTAFWSFKFDFDAIGATAANLITTRILTAVNYGMAASSSNAVLNVRTFANWPRVAALMSAVRPTGSAITVSNTSAALDLNGSMQQRQMSWDYPFTNFLAPAISGVVAADGTVGYSLLSTFADADRRSADNGTYTYLKPGPNSFAWHEDWQASKAGTYEVAYDLDHMTDYMVVAFSGSTTSLSQEMTVEAMWEARTSDQTREQALPSGDPLDTVELQAFMQKVPQYDCNPMHLRDLAGYALKAANFVERYAPSAAALAAKLAALTF